MSKAIKIFLCILCITNASAQEDNLYPAEVVKVYDGDTFTIDVTHPDFNNDYYDDYYTSRVKVRLHACDTYEMKSEKLTERTKAYTARSITKALLSKGTFYIRYIDKDRYKRLVCDVTLSDGRDLKQVLRQARLLTGKYEKDDE